MKMTSNANKIINIMQDFLPEDWKKVCLCIETDENSFEGDYFVFLQDNTMLRSLELCKQIGLSEIKLNDMYKEVYLQLKPLRDSLKKKGTFNRYLLNFDREKFDEHYDYSTIEEGNYFFDFWLRWKSEYVHL